MKGSVTVHCAAPLGGGEWRRRLSIVYCREGEGRRMEGREVRRSREKEEIKRLLRRI